MTKNHQTIEIEIPSGSRLLKSVFFAVFAAAAILVTIILPAERAIDPTGLGRLLGLTEMGEIKKRRLEETMQEASDILSKAAQLEALTAIQKRLDAIEEKLPDIKSPSDVK
jgi:hypothetical protein